MSSAGDGTGTGDQQDGHRRREPGDSLGYVVRAVGRAVRDRTDRVDPDGRGGAVQHGGRARGRRRRRGAAAGIRGKWLVRRGRRGLLGIAVHPTYPEPPLVYAYFTTERGGERINRVVAFDTAAEEPNDSPWVIAGSQYHNGGRITFGPANYLWIAAGDGDPRVFTYGHRNPRGLSWLPDGTPVIAEHGPDGGVYAITSNRDGRASDPLPAERDDRLVRVEPAE